jgi:acyl carrier protein
MISWKVLLEALNNVKTIDADKVELNSYVSRDLGIDSIGVVDLWFEIKNLIKQEGNLNAFYKHIRSNPNREFYNDFTIKELADYLKLDTNA